MVGIRPTRFEPVPSWCTGGSVERVSKLKVSLLAVTFDELCLLFRFEGAGHSADDSSRTA